MPARAPNATSLPYRRGQCNTRRPENSQTRARCASRLACITDRRLHHGAARLYVLLDDYAGAKGVCWPKQATLGHRLGASRQSVQRWIAELERAGWLAIERTGRAHRYTLRWAIQDRASDRRPCGHRISVYQPEVIEHAGVGVVGHADEPKSEAPGAGKALRHVPPIPGQREGLPPSESDDSGWNRHSQFESGTPAPIYEFAGGGTGAADCSIQSPAGGACTATHTPAICPHCHGAGEREYRVSCGRDWRGKPIPERRWRGRCGCRD